MTPVVVVARYPRVTVRTRGVPLPVVAEPPPGVVVVQMGVQGRPGRDGVDGVDGTDGGGSGAQEIFVQATAPVAHGPWLWVQTGLPGGGFTMWFEDGL